MPASGLREGSAIEAEGQMPIHVHVTIKCDGVGCYEGEDCDDLQTIGDAERWARANGWTVGKRTLCPKCQTTQSLRLIREQEAEIARALARDRRPR